MKERRGRPRKLAKDRRTEPLMLKLTPDEMAQLKKTYGKTDLSVRVREKVFAQ